MKNKIVVSSVLFMFFFSLFLFQYGANTTEKVSQFLNGVEQAKSRSIVLNFFKNYTFSADEIEIIKKEIKKQAFALKMQRQKIQYDYVCVQYENEEQCVKTVPVCVKRNAYGACVQYESKCVETKIVQVCKKWALRAL